MNEIKRFFAEESGIGVVELILILVVLVGLVLLFKDKLTRLVKNAFNTINGKVGELNE